MKQFHALAPVTWLDHTTSPLKLLQPLDTVDVRSLNKFFLHMNITRIYYFQSLYPPLANTEFTPDNPFAAPLPVSGQQFDMHKLGHAIQWIENGSGRYSKPVNTFPWDDSKNTHLLLTFDAKLGVQWSFPDRGFDPEHFAFWTGKDAKLDHNLTYVNTILVFVAHWNWEIWNLRTGKFNFEQSFCCKHELFDILQNPVEFHPATSFAPTYLYWSENDASHKGRRRYIEKKQNLNTVVFEY